MFFGKSEVVDEEFDFKGENVNRKEFRFIRNLLF